MIIKNGDVRYLLWVLFYFVYRSLEAGCFILEICILKRATYRIILQVQTYIFGNFVKIHANEQTSVHNIESKTMLGEGVQLKVQFVVYKYR